MTSFCAHTTLIPSTNMQTEKRFTDKSGTASPPKKSKLAAQAAAPAAAMEVEGGLRAPLNAAAAPFLMQIATQAAEHIQVNPQRSISKSGVLHCFDTDNLEFITKRFDEQKITSMPVRKRR